MSNSAEFFGSSSVTVDAAGALTGDGTPGAPLAVSVDGVTVTIVGNSLVAPTGGGGTIGGNLGATDNVVPRSSGTGGATLASSALSIGDTGIATGLSLIDFATAKGLSFAGAASAITVKGGDDGFGDTAIVFTNAEDYVPFVIDGGAFAFQAAGGIYFSNPTGVDFAQADSFTVNWQGATTYLGLKVGDGAGPSYTTADGVTCVGTALTANGVAGFAVGYQANVYGTGSNAALFGSLFQTHVNSGTSTTVHGLGVATYAETAATVTSHSTVSYLRATATGNAVIPEWHGVWMEYAITSGAPTITWANAFYVSDMAGMAVNPYYFWADSQGVYRIREDNVADSGSFPQAIPALYNPRFTKYTAGLANFERTVEQWVGNVAQFGVQAGGTGTLRKIQLIGAGLLLNTTILPTSDPGVPGQLYASSGTVKVSL